MTSTETHRDTDPAAPSTARKNRHLRNAVLASVVGLAMACTATVGSAAAHPVAAATANTTVTNPGKIYFGVDGTVSKAAAGQNVARHVYGQLTHSVPNARMVTMGINGYTYADISAAAPGSTIYTDVVRWADTIKARGTQTFFGFVHEPEATDNAKLGTAPEYIAAYQHVVDIMRAQDVPNVSYVWQLTAYGFVRKDARNAVNYYPGDNYVDYVAADAYNWDGCVARSTYRDLSAIADPVLAFAEAHNKLAMLAEFGTETSPQRAAWLNSAQQYLIANRSEIVAAFYFDLPPVSGGANCNWSLTDGTDISAFQAIADDTTYFTS